MLLRTFFHAKVYVLAAPLHYRPIKKYASKPILVLIAYKTVYFKMLMMLVVRVVVELMMMKMVLKRGITAR